MGLEHPAAFIDEPQRACIRCRFWQDADEIYGGGQCRRNPPGNFKDAHQPRWPETGPDDWCGEFARL